MSDTSDLPAPIGVRPQTQKTQHSGATPMVNLSPSTSTEMASRLSRRDSLCFSFHASHPHTTFKPRSRTHKNKIEERPLSEFTGDPPGEHTIGEDGSSVFPSPNCSPSAIFPMLSVLIQSLQTKTPLFSLLQSRWDLFAFWAFSR